VKVTLFAITALSAAVLAISQVTEVGGADAQRGVGKEFEAAITAVIGGTLLTGGLGSPLGTVLGALTLAVVQQGLYFAGVDASWYQFVLGFILLAAVLLNRYVLRKATESRA
jgi:simple sugar transport system permease protein